MRTSWVEGSVKDKAKGQLKVPPFSIQLNLSPTLSTFGCLGCRNWKMRDVRPQACSPSVHTHCILLNQGNSSCKHHFKGHILQGKCHYQLYNFMHQCWDHVCGRWQVVDEGWEASYSIWKLISEKTERRSSHFLPLLLYISQCKCEKPIFPWYRTTIK